MRGEIEVGALVSLVPIADPNKLRPIGMIIRGPEPFGFIDRCLVKWSTNRSDLLTNPSWVDINCLEVIYERKS